MLNKTQHRLFPTTMPGFGHWTLITSLFLLPTYSETAGCDGQYSYIDAKSCCKSMGQSIPSALTFHENEHLRNILVYKNETTTWIGIGRVTFPSWKWLDGTTQAKTTSEGQGGCAFYNVSSKKIGTSSCGSNSHGHICEVTNCKTCYSTGIHRHLCQKVGGHCYTMHCEGKNWYKAGEDCRSWNATLSVKTKKLSLAKTSKACIGFWIGLREVDWKQTTDKYIGSTGVSYWGPNEPNTYGDCAIFSLTKIGFQWKTTICDEEHTILCMPTEVTTKQTVPYTHMGNKTRAPFDVERKAYFLTVVLPIIVSILVIVCVIGIIWYRKRKEKQLTDSTDESEQLLEKLEDNTVDGALQIINYEKKTNHFDVNLDNLKHVLTRNNANCADSPLVVLSIIGPFRMGKSFLMNFIARILTAMEIGNVESWADDQEKSLKGFPWKHGADVATLGMWMWNRPFRISLESGNSVSILLVDTQGIFDEPNMSEAASMVSLSSIISSMQIYNVMEKISDDDFRSLELIITSSKMLKKLANEQAMEPLIKRLIFLIRDKESTPESPGYSEGGKQLIDTLCHAAKRFDVPDKDRERKKRILEVVGDLECFIMPRPRPHGSAKSGNEFTGKLNDITKVFQTGLYELTKLLFDEEKIVRLECFGHRITGNDLLQRIIKFTSYFNIGRMAKPESTAEALIEDMNTLELRNAMLSFYQIISEVPAGNSGDFITYVESCAPHVYQQHKNKFIGGEHEIKGHQTRLREILNITSAQKFKSTQNDQDPREMQTVFQNMSCGYLQSMKTVMADFKSVADLDAAHNTEKAKIIQNLANPELVSDVEAFINSIFHVLKTAIGK